MNEFDQADDLAVSIRGEYPPQDIVELRQKLIEKYHEGSASLLDRLSKQGKDTLDALLVCLVDEIIKETDSLLGNELVAAHSGNLRDASVISFKRAEVIEKALKAIQAKQVFERESGIDVFSPSMAVVFKYFMGKVHEAMVRLKYEDEAKDVFFKTLGGIMTGWQKELQEELDVV
jgi:hypothetical protein